MQLECPHCGARLKLPPVDHDILKAAGVMEPRLRGDDHVCRECDHELGVYYY